MKISYEISQNKCDLFQLDYVKNYLRITHDYDDQLIHNLFETALEHCQQILRIKIRKHTIKAKIIDASKIINLKYACIVSLASITSNGKKIAVADFVESLNLQRNKLILQEDMVGGDFELQYVVGYSQSNIPSGIRQGILMYLSKLYEQPPNMQQIDQQINQLIMPYRQHMV